MKIFIQILSQGNDQSLGLRKIFFIFPLSAICLEISRNKLLKFIIEKHLNVSN